MKSFNAAVIAVVATQLSSAHYIDLDVPPEMDTWVDVVPEGSGKVDGYRATTDGWQMRNHYVLTATDFTITTRVGYKGDFKDGNIIQSFT